MKKISVIVPTIRLGGFDILLNCLKAQTMPESDWELIIVDEFYNYRTALLSPGRLFDRDVNVRHMPPARHTLFVDDDKGYNQGLRMARGELIMFLTDYIWLPANTLQHHWDVYVKSGKRMSVCGYMDHYESPPLKVGESVMNTAGERNFVGNPSWSVYDREFDKEYAALFFAAHKPTMMERYGSAPSEYVDYVTPGIRLVGPDWFYMAINHSIPYEVLRKVNGLDEHYTGHYGLTDVDLGLRAVLSGWQFCIADDTPITKALDTSKVPRFVKYVLGSSEGKRPEMMARWERMIKGDESYRAEKGFGAFE